MSGMATTSSSAGHACEAIPAVGIGWETVSFSIPKPRLFAVPRPQAGPQVVGIPILAGAPTMTMAAPMMAQPQYVPTPSQPAAAPQGEPQAAPASEYSPCQRTGCAEGCSSHDNVAAECDALIREISNLQQEIRVESRGTTISTRR